MSLVSGQLSNSDGLPFEMDRNDTSRVFSFLQTVERPAEKPKAKEKKDR